MDKSEKLIGWTRADTNTNKAKDLLYSTKVKILLLLSNGPSTTETFR